MHGVESGEMGLQFGHLCGGIDVGGLSGLVQRRQKWLEFSMLSGTNDEAQEIPDVLLRFEVLLAISSLTGLGDDPQSASVRSVIERLPRLTWSRTMISSAHIARPSMNSRAWTSATDRGTPQLDPISAQWVMKVSRLCDQVHRSRWPRHR